MRDRQTCIDCGKQSPETETNYTLISAQFGWRLSRRRDRNGDFVVEWRCADCWREHKKKLDADGSATASSTKTPAMPRRESQVFAAPARSSPSASGRAASSAPSKPPPRSSTRPPSQAPGAVSPSEPPRRAPGTPPPPPTRPRRP